MDKTDVLQFEYKISSETGQHKDFCLKLDNQTLRIISSPSNQLPDWTLLDFYKCPNCTLDSDQTKHCPVAVNLHPIMTAFKDSLSYESSEITLKTSDRTYSKQTSLQQGVSSMIGIIMVSSGCPILSKLRPMVRFHLPFANPQETLYRTVSTYLMQQYYRHKKGLPADWDLEGLTEIYRKVHDVNVTFFKRLSNLNSKDANLNALIILDNFASYVNFSLDNERLLKLEPLFGELD